MSINIPQTLDGLCYRYPSLLVDLVVEHRPGERLVGIKNVTVNEEFFQGHFPGTPLMPGVLMIETLAQVASLLLLHREGQPPSGRAVLRAVNDAKFRRQVVPGDQLRLEVEMGRRRGTLVKAAAVAYVGDQVVAEAELVMLLRPGPARIDPSARVHPGAVIGEGTIVEPNAIIGEHVRIGRNCRVGASAIVDGFTEIGDDNQVFPFASVGLIPQDLKFRGETTTLRIGNGNIFREFVTIHRGTAGGGGLTEIGDRNVFMAYSHVAHDCRIGSHTIFANGASLAGHVLVEDYATIGALSGVHQFCRVGRYAFIGGLSKATKDALPFAKTVGIPARIYGLNTVGLVRRGFSPEVLLELKRAFHYLLHAKLNTSQAIQEIEQDASLSCEEVVYLVNFIRGSARGVVLRRPGRRAEEAMDED